MSNDTELKPCPFCGGSATEDWSESRISTVHTRQYGWITCDNCGAEVTIESVDDNCGSKELHEKWNTRHE